MQYSREFIPEHEVPRAVEPVFQHVVDIYASEANKMGAVWREVGDDQLDFRPHVRSSSIRQIMTHQILSERRFFAEFIGLTEPPPESLLPPGDALPVRAYVESFIGLARSRLPSLAAGDQAFWLTDVPFFDVRRQRIWVFWRRVLHTAHHRAQVGDCLRLLNTRVPATYGPTADVTWSGADPTTTLEAARRS
jgi:DinB family protein